LATSARSTRPWATSRRSDNPLLLVAMGNTMHTRRLTSMRSTPVSRSPSTTP
jgi:hypothetical protein